eukprot:s151_g10.t1
MFRFASVAAAVCLALHAAGCFLLPSQLVKCAAHKELRAEAGQPSALTGTSEPFPWSPLVVGAAFGLLISVATAAPALATDLEKSQASLQGNCTDCHVGGLLGLQKKESLVEYRKYNVQAIITRFSDDRGTTPAVGEKMRPDNFEDVANYDAPTVDYVARFIARTQQKYTHRGGVRPFGISTLLGGFDNKGMPALFQTDPAGTYYAWKATAIGKNSKSVTDFLEKKYKEDLDEDATIRLALKGLLEVTEASGKNIEVVIVKESGITWMPDDQLEPLVKELDDTAEKIAKLKEQQ